VGAVEPDELPDPVAVAITFCGYLERLGIPYVIGGSFASSVHGDPRSTNDVDVIADIREPHVPAFIAGMDPAFYVSEDAVREAIHIGSAFNVIHMRAGIKVDVFVAADDDFNQERIRSRMRVTLGTDPDGALYFDTAEHSILRKLEWFRRGGEVSERQWRDVLGILRVQRDRLDAKRLREWAARLAVSDLLDRAMVERDSSRE
jgi:hypothetical protein